MVPNGGKQVKFFGGPIVIVPSNKKKKPSDPSSQEAYNQNRTEESKHRDSVLPPTKTPCCCGGQGWPIRVSHSPPKKKDGVNLFVDFRRHFNDDVVFCVCVCVGWVFGEWLWGGKRLFGTWGLSYWKPFLGVLSNMDFADRDLTFGGFISEESTKNFKWDRCSNKVW